MTDEAALNLLRDDLGIPAPLLVNRAAEVSRRTFDDWAGDYVQEFTNGGAS